MRVFRLSDSSLVGEDRAYDGASAGVDFFKDGRLISTGLDGQLRLYRVHDNGWSKHLPELSLQLLARGPAPGGAQPVAARFSPDGTLVAVGSTSTAVNVLDAHTLEFRYAPDTRGVGSGNRGIQPPDLATVEWSRDGRVLYAAGAAADSGYRVRSWTHAGRGEFTDTLAASSTIMDLRSLPDGSVAFGSGDSSWGIIDAVGHVRVRITSPNANFFTPSEVLHVARDGGAVRYTYEGEAPSRFDLASRTISPDPGGSGMAAPRRQGLAVENWSYATPTLGGKQLPMLSGELSTSLAVAPDARTFALGTGWNVYLFDRSGAQVWERSAPGFTYSVNISGDGRLVVAAFADGTIRWYRHSDGQELLALYPHADRRRWVLWTPSGYYDASPGGEELIGWHVNRGAGQLADFFPVSRFRDELYRPDVLARVLGVLDEAEALRLANLEAGRPQREAQVLEELPPVVEILSPDDGSTFQEPTVAVQIRIRASGDAPATELRVRVDGQAVRAANRTEPVIRAAGGELAIPVPRRDSTVQVFANSRNGWSVPATLHMVWSGPPADAPRIRLYVLAFGVGHYRSPDLEVLSYAQKDAEDFAAAMRRQERRLYEKVTVRWKPEEKTTRDEILRGLNWLRKEVTSNDVAVVFFSGHGEEDDDGRYYFLPVDADPADLLRTAVPKEDFLHVLSSLAGKVVFFMDSCHAGLLAEGGHRKGATDMTRVVNEMASIENGLAVYASSTGRQSSLEYKSWENGAFTKALVEGLSGKGAADRSGVITHQRLATYVSDRVKELTRGRQHPVPGNAGVPDFPIAAAP